MSELSQRRVVIWCLRIYSCLLISLTALAWVVYFANRCAPLNSPLFDRADRFRDLLNYKDKIAHLADGGAALGTGLPVYNYPAPAAYLYAFFLRGFPHHPVRAYLSLLLAGLLCGAILLWRYARIPGSRNWSIAVAIAATVIFGFPMVFTADRGNLEGAVWLIVSAGLVLYIAQRYFGAAILIGLAASIKPFPGLFLLLLIRKKLYRQAFVGLVAAACATIVALTALGPTPIAAYRGLKPGITRYYNKYIMNDIPPNESRFSHSTMDALKIVPHHWLRSPKKNTLNFAPTTKSNELSQPPQSMPAGKNPTGAEQTAFTRTSHYSRMKIILIGSVFLDAFAFAFVLFRLFKLPTVNQIILLSIAVTLFPPVAAEYTLIHLYVPFGLFVIFLAKDVATGHLAAKFSDLLKITVLFALLFSPLTFFGPYAGAVQMLLLVTLLGVVGIYPMPSSIFREMDPHIGTIPSQYGSSA